MSVLTVQDFFAVGLGLDLAGGYLLARGLLVDEADMATSRTFAGWGAQSTVSQAQDRVDAKLGLLYFGLGFLLQVLGYIAEEGGVGAGATGTGPAAFFLLLTLASLAAALIFHRYQAPAQIRELALRVTMLDGYGLHRDVPDGRDMMDLGVEFGHDAREDESYGQYAKRVWNFDAVTDADDVPDEGERLKRQAGRKPTRI